MRETFRVIRATKLYQVGGVASCNHSKLFFSAIKSNEILIESSVYE